MPRRLLPASEAISEAIPHLLLVDGDAHLQERLWLEEKRVWISGKGEDSAIIGEGESLDASDPVEAESSESERAV